MKIISMFNHKGGVSKTTTTFNLAWTLANQGKRVLMVDADPQCNLTGAALGLNPVWPSAEDEENESDDGAGFSQKYSDSQEAATNFWEENFENTLFGALKPAFDSAPKLLEPVSCIEIEGRPGLFLLPGHLRLGEFEVSLGIAQELAGSLTSLQNLPGAIYYLLKVTAEAMNIDVIILDMSPGLGALNQNLVAISDQLIVPTSPDFYSIMAMRSLSSVLPRWVRWAKSASNNEVLKQASYPFPEPTLKLGGIVVQRYRLYRKPDAEQPYGTPTRPFQTWIEKVQKEARENFVPALEEAGLLYPSEEYARADIPDSKVLAQIQEFNSLLPKSQEHRVPVFELTDAQLNQSGTVLDNSRGQIASLQRIFSSFGQRVSDLLGE